MRAHHHGVVHKGHTIRNGEDQFHIADLVLIDRLEINLGLQGEIVTCHHFCLIDREEGSFAGIIEFALVKEGDDHILHGRDDTALYRYFIPHIVCILNKAGLIESSQTAERVEQAALAHRNKCIGGVG